jgi:hypothetical protein
MRRGRTALQHAIRPVDGYFFTIDSCWTKAGNVGHLKPSMMTYLPVKNYLPNNQIFQLINVNSARDGTDATKLMRDFLNEIETPVNMFCCI